MEFTLSVIIPVYKTENTLERCLKSVLTNAVNEVILIDDGSPDRSGEMCDKWAKSDSRIKVLHKKNGGLSDARNEGLKMVTSSFVTFVDSDDEITPNTYAPLISFLTEHPNIDILEYPAQIHVGDKSEHHIIYNNKISNISSEEQKKILWLNDLFSHAYVCNKIFRYNLFDNIIFEKGKLFEDVLITPRLLSKASYYATYNNGLYIYYSNDNGISRNFSNLTQLIYAQLRICKEMNIDIMSKESDRLFLSLVNTQIDICRYNKNAEITLPERKIHLSSATNNRERIKILLNNILGLKGLIKLFVLFRHLSIIMVFAYIFQGLTF